MEDNVATVTCLICNNYFDRKPIISFISGDLNEEVDQVNEFNSGFKLLLKLLNLNTINDLDVGREDEDDPCCGSCHLALEDLVKLQKIIKEAEEKQREVVDSLKDIIWSNRKTNASILHRKWAPLRLHLLHGLQGVDEILPDNDFELRRSTGYSEDGDQHQESEDSDEDYQPPEKKRKVVLVQKRGRKVQHVPLMEVEEITDTGGEKVKPKPKQKPKRARNMGLQKQGSNTRRTNFRNLFYFIQENVYMFRSSLVEVSPMEFKCLETDCHHRVEGYDYFTFQEIKAHILQHHLDEKDSDARICPLCNKSFDKCADIRNHFVKDHAKRKLSSSCDVICESCWRPIPYHCHSYHVWFHKNDEEKQAHLTSGEPISTKIKIKLGLHQDPRKKKRGPPPPPRLSCDLSNPNENLVEEVEQEQIQEKTQIIQEDDNLELDECNKSDQELRDAEDNDEDYQPLKKSLKIKIKRNVGRPAKRREVTSQGPQGRPLGRLTTLLLDVDSKLKSAAKDRKKGSRVYFKTLFYKVSSNICLFRTSLVQISPTEFTCLELNCHHKVKGCDYFTYQEMKAHVIENHPDEKNDKSCRTCPLCHKSFMNPDSIRYHYVRDHANKSLLSKCDVMCESCGMTLPYHSYTYHIWFHKNEEEMQEAISSGEPISGKVMVKLGLHKKKSLRDTCPDPEEPQKRKRSGVDPDRDMLRKNCFIRLGKNYLYYKNIIIKCTGASFICGEDCGKEVNGCDYLAFLEMEQHVDENHLSEVEQSKQRTCPLCKVAYDGATFTQHIFNVHKPKGICICCGKPFFKSHTGMMLHLYTHMNQEEKRIFEADGKYEKYLHPRQTLNCQFCGKLFAKKLQLTAHEKTHEPSHLRRQYKCEECNAQFMSYNGLKCHKETVHHPELRELSICPVCGMTFLKRRKGRFEEHLRGHTGERPFVCEICGKAFMSRRTCRVHVESVHATIRRYQCEFCEKTYKLKFLLNKHVATAHKSGR